MGTVNVFLGPSATSQNSADYSLNGWDKDGGALTLTTWSWTETGNGGYVLSHANLIPGCSYWLRKTSGGTPWAQGEIGANVIADIQSGLATTAQLDSMSGATFDTSTDSLEAIRNRGDAAWTSGSAQPIPYAPTSIAYTLGNDESPGGEDYTDLAAHDDVYVQCGESAADGLTFDVLATLSGKQTENPTLVRISAFYNGAVGHELAIQTYNYVSAAYESVATMKSRTTPFDYVIPLDADNHDPANGSMKIRFLHNAVTYNATHYLRVDYVSFEKRSVTDALAADVASILATVNDLDLEVDSLVNDGVKLGDVAHGGAAATITAERIVVASTTTNEPAFKLTGNGTAPGLYSKGGGGTSAPGIKAEGGDVGSSAHGFVMVGGPSGGIGLKAEAGAGGGAGIEGTGLDDAGIKGYASGSNAYGILGQGTNGASGARFEGDGAGDGIYAVGGATGSGIKSVGGATSGEGIYATANGGGSGIYAQATGTGNAGIWGYGATDAAGITGTGGSGNANGIQATGSGTGSGIDATGGADGNGMTLTKGAGGSKDLDADEIADAATIAAAVTVDMDANSTQLAAILEDTGTTIPTTLGTPADTDLATDIANIAVGGVPGDILFTWTELNSGNQPVSDVTVIVYSNNTATGQPITSGLTDEVGQVKFYLDEGTYYLFRRKAGRAFTNPQTIVVS